jgi:hypothetical protein
MQFINNKEKEELGHSKIFYPPVFFIFSEGKSGEPCVAPQFHPMT